MDIVDYPLHSPLLVGRDVLQELLDILVVADRTVVVLQVLDRLVVGHDVALAAHHVHHVLARARDHLGQLQLKMFDKASVPVRVLFLPSFGYQQLRSSQRR